MHNKKRFHHLTKSQQRYWVMTNFYKFNDLYNMALGLYIDSPLNFLDLKRALKNIVKQQPLLRTCIVENDIGPQQIEMNSIENLPFKIISEAQVSDYGLKFLLEAEIQVPFNFTDGSPLWRLVAIETSPQQTYLFLVMHHLISDAWSFEIFFQQLSDLYLNDISPEINNYFFDVYLDKELEHLSNKQAAENAAIFWKKHLSGASFQLDFPFESSGTTEEKNQGAYHNFLINKSLYNDLKTTAKQHKCSIFTLLFSAYAILLSKLTQQNDFVIGTMVAARSTLEQNDVIGCFANILPLHVQISDIKIQQFISEVQATLYNMVEHQSAPFHDIIANLRNDPNTKLSDLFQTLFVFQNSLGSMSNLFGSEDSSIDPNEYTRTIAEFPLLLLLRESKDGLCINIQYSLDQFSTASIESICHQYENIISLLSKSLEHNLNAYKILSTNEMSLMQSVNNTDCRYDYTKHFINFFTDQVQLNPRKSALYVGHTISYQDLDISSSRIAKLLEEAGVKNKQVVGVCLPRNETLIATLLAIFKLNAVYFPLDQNYNSERLINIVNFAKPVILVNNNTTAHVTERCNLSELNLDLCSSISEPLHFEPSVVHPEDPAYLLFTSGSTGEPKPVLIYHKNLTNLLYWGKEYFSSEELSAIFAGSSVNFDASVIEIFLPLAWGGQVILAENILYYSKIAIQQPIKMLTGTPSGVAALLRTGHLASSTISLFLSGEPLPSDLLKGLLDQPKILRVINGYGLTELAAYSLVFSTNKFYKCVPIGKPISNTGVYIVDQKNNPLPVGAIGQICITGDGVPTYKNPLFQVIDERFISFKSYDNQRLDGFLTGDLGQMLPDGNIACLGRKDGQVKVRGYRIDRSEIEATIRQFPGVENAAVITQEAADSNKVLIGFYQCKTGHDINEVLLRQFISKKLPVYMVPTIFNNISSIPYNINGKVDYKKLLPSKITLPPKRAVEKQNYFVELVKKIWCEVLSISEVDNSSSFFLLGGHSLAIPLLAKKFEILLNLDIPITAFFMYVTVQEFAEYLASITHELPSVITIDEDIIVGDQDIAIIGCACRLPLVDSPDSFWNVLVNQVNLISEAPETRWEWRKIQEEISELASTHNPCRYGAFIEGMAEFDARFFNLSDKEAKYMDPQQRLLLESAWQAIENAGYTPSLLTKNSERVGVFIGASNSEYSQILARQNLSTEIYHAAGNAPSVLANRISYIFGFGGSSLTIDTACSSALTALHYAVESLRKGENEYALVGSASLLLSPENYIVWNKMGIISNNDKNQTFDANASGFIPGEGVVSILIKSAKKAVEDGDHIWGVIKGSATNHDGSAKVGINSVSPKRQKDLIRSACLDAKLDINKIDYFEMHGTGTKLGDPVEIAGLSSALHESTEYLSHPKKKFIGAVKTLTGHTGPASGLVGLLKVLLCFKHQQLTATKINELNPNIKLDENQLMINQTIVSWDKNTIKRAGISAFGFAGSNAHVIVETYLQQRTPNHFNDNAVYLFVLSAKSKDSLTLLVRKYIDFLSQTTLQSQLADICYTAAVGREHFKHRLAVVVKSLSEIIANLSSYLIDESNIVANREQISQVQNLSIIYDVATDYMRGNNIDWPAFWLQHYPDVLFSKQPLPTYAFEKEKFWVNASNLKQFTQPATVAVSLNRAVFKSAGFEKSNIIFEKQEPLNFLIFTDQYGVGESLKKELGNEHCILVYVGENYFKLNEYAYQINPQVAADYKVLFEQLKKDERYCLIYCFAIEKFNTGEYTKLRHNIAALHHLVHNLKPASPHISQIRFITTNAYEKTDFAQATFSIAQHALLASFRSLMLDQHLPWQIIDVDINELSRLSAELGKIILSLIVLKEIVLRRSGSYIPILRPITTFTSIAMPCALAGHYVITGGLGALSLTLTKWLLENTDSKLTLLSRNNDNKTLPDWLISYQLNNRATLLECDLTDVDQLILRVSEARNLHGEIKGVFHLAGTLTEGNIDDVTLKTIDEVMLVKIKGALNLLDVFNKTKLDFIIVFSSLAAWYGRRLSAEYACANAYLNGLAMTLHSTNSDFPFYSLALCGIEGLGMGASSNITNNHGCINAQEFLRIIELYLKNLNEAVTYVEGDATLAVKPIHQAVSKITETMLSTEQLIKILSRITEIPCSSIDARESVLHYGLDSISAISLTNQINQNFSFHCSVTDIFSAKNIIDLVQKINQQPIVHSQEAVSVESKKEEVLNFNIEKNSLVNDSIAIIGVSFQFPNALNEEELWGNLDRTKDSVIDLNITQLAELYGLNDLVKNKFDGESFSAGFLQNRLVFDPLFFKISPQEAESMCEEQKLLLVLAYAALEDSGYINTVSQLSTGVYIGAAENFFMDLEVLQSHSLLGNSMALYANRISYYFDLHGPSISLNTLCSSSLVALDMAVKSLRHSEIDLAIVGSARCKIDPNYYQAAKLMQAISKSGKCHSYSDAADGFSPGEGGAVFILKRLSDASKDYDNILGVIRGSAVNHSGYHAGLTVPDVNAQAAVVNAALLDANISCADVTYIEGHGTGTKIGDPIEIEALTRVFQDMKENHQCAIGSIKANIGHLEPASGMAGIVKILLAMRHKKIPGTPHLHQLNQKIPMKNTAFYFPKTTVLWSSIANKPRVAGVSGFSISGTNAHVILEEPSDDVFKEKARANWLWKHQILIFSAYNSIDLLNLLINQMHFLECNKVSLFDIAYTLNTTRKYHRCRLAICVNKVSNLKSAIEEHVQHLKNSSNVQKSNVKSKKLILLFGGFDASHLQMLQKFYHNFPDFKKQFDYCDNILNKKFSISLLEILNQQSSSKEKNEYIDELFSFVASLSYFRVLVNFSCQPDLVIGYDHGEYVAACVAGVMSVDDAIMMLSYCGRLLSALPTDIVKLDIKAEEKIVTDLFESIGISFEIAAMNAKNFIVVAVRKTELSNIEQIFKEYGIEYEKSANHPLLHTSHSNQVTKNFAHYCSKFEFKPNSIAFISSFTGEIVPIGSNKLNATYWADRITQPIRFDRSIQALTVSYRNEAIYDMGRAILTQVQRSGQPIPMQHVIQDVSADYEKFPFLLANMFELGIDINFKYLYQGYSGHRLRMPTYPFSYKSIDLKTKSGEDSKKNTMQSSFLNEENIFQIQNITLFLKEEVAKNLKMPFNEIDIEQPLLDLGADSLLLSALLNMLQNKFNVTISMLQLYEEIVSIKDLANYIQQLTFKNSNPDADSGLE